MPRSDAVIKAGPNSLYVADKRVASRCIVQDDLTNVHGGSKLKPSKSTPPVYRDALIVGVNGIGCAPVPSW